MRSFLMLSVVMAVASCLPLSQASQNIIISKGYIAKLCSDNCHEVADKDLVQDCERGCRFFDYAQSSDMEHSNNETRFHSLCVDSCNEAYIDEQHRRVCTSGCDHARDEIEHIVQMGTQLLEEADKQISFLNPVFDMMFSALWNTESEEEDDDGQLIDTVDGSVPRVNQLDRQQPLGTKDVEILTMLGNEMDQAEASFCATRMWLHRLSFILIVLGALSLLFISFFYLLAVIKQRKAARNSEMAMSTSEPVLSSPPSYETLVKNGYICVLDKNDMVAPVHEEKKDKLLLA